MFLFPPTIILRHRKENLKKCSLRGLESRPDCRFFTYPHEELPDLSQYISLTIDAPPLSREDGQAGLFIIDATWRYAEVMAARIPATYSSCRSIPAGFVTAYPREQTGCSDPERGLASVEALFIAYHLIGRETKGLLDGYHWREKFLEKNKILLNT